jgi:hypothetical protein
MFFFAGKMIWPKASSNGRAGTPRETAGTQPRDIFGLCIRFGRRTLIFLDSGTA